MLSFEGIIDKITVCKKIKSFTEEIFKKLPKSLRYCSSYVAKFRHHTLQDDKIMGFLIQLCAVQSKL